MKFIRNTKTQPTNFIDARYVSAPEPMWRLLDLENQKRCSPGLPVRRIKLRGCQMPTFRPFFPVTAAEVKDMQRILL